MSNSNEDRLWFGYDVNADRPGINDINHVARQPQNQLDKDAFLRLLLTQMQYQDPLNPTDDRQFIAQMAQLTVAEQMQNMAQSFAHTQAYAMLGKSVYAEVIDDNTSMVDEVFGQVTAVLMRKGEAILMVGEKEVPVKSVRMVVSDNLTDSINNLAVNTVTSQALSLMGKTVQAITLNGKGEPEEFIEGKVDNVKFDARGNPLLVIGSKEVYPREVIAVGDGPMLIGKDITAFDTPIPGAPPATGSGMITGVKIKDGNTYLQLSDGKEFFVHSVALVTDAYRYVDKPISHGSTSGIAKDVVIRNGVPHLTINGKLGDTPPPEEINFAAYRGIRFDQMREETD